MKFFLSLLLLLSQYAFGQTFYNPKCSSQLEPDLKIAKVALDENSTTVSFEYVRNEAKEIYILLHAPNTEGAYFIKADGKTYKLTSTNGIGNVDGVTPAHQYETVKFSATFEALPKSTSRFDLIEGGVTGSWHFYGVELKSNQSANLECDKITYTAMSPKPDFRAMMAGVKNVVIANEAKINGQVPAFNALYEFLNAMGFESVTTLANYQASDNIAEDIFVNIGFDYDLERFTNINMSFHSSATGYSWDFTTNKVANSGLYSDPKRNFGIALRDMYGYQKNVFNSAYTMQLAKKQTCWTEALLRSDIQINGCDKLGGIYENSASSVQMAKYRVGVRKINGRYCLIYFSGAQNDRNWTEGEIKATLESTANPLLFKAKWIMADKSENENFYISFENGIMNIIDPTSKKEVYIKMFPSMAESVSAPSESASSGTGYAISNNGYIVTNYHVTNGANSIKVRGVKGDFTKAFTAQVVIDDKNNDLSIIKISDSQFTSLGAIPYVIANKSVDVGSSIFVLGYPLRATMGDEVKLTNGIISAKSGFQGDVTSYQVNASVQPGNSGGPLFDNNGNIVGVINAKHVGAENVSYAIKTSYLLNLIDLMPSPPKLQTISAVSGKPLTEQIKVLKNFTYIIEINN